MRIEAESVDEYVTKVPADRKEAVEKLRKTITDMLSWFKESYSNLGIGKPDMGKACLRLKKMDAIPYDLIGELCGKITLEQYLSQYVNTIKR